MTGFGWSPKSPASGPLSSRKLTDSVKQGRVAYWCTAFRAGLWMADIKSHRIESQEGLRQPLTHAGGSRCSLPQPVLPSGLGRKL